MPLDGGDGFNDAPWQNFSLGSLLYKTRGSHSGVYTSLPDFAALYGRALVGTLPTVEI